jgi:CubicO group peptidase (beta-lactamase class C family)
MAARALAAALAVACATGPRAAPATIDEAGLAARIDPIAAAILADAPAAAMSVAIARGGRIVFAKGYGVADRERKRAATAATVYRIGSVTKQYTAALILKLVEDGRLTLEDPLLQHLPDYPSQAKAVTIRHLLTHTAGIYNYTDAAFVAQAARPLTLAQLIALFAAKPLDFEPGTKWAYSNSGYVLLGAVAEKVAGKPYRTLVEERLLGPAGLAHTGYSPDQPSRPEEAAGYALKDGRLGPAAPISMTSPYAAGALCANVIDLASWSLALHQGRVVQKESLLQMTTPVALSGGGTFPYGFGLMMGEADGHEVIAHGGGINGFVSHLAYYPKDDLTVAVLCNTESEAADRAGKRIARALLGIPEAKLRDLPLDEAEAARYVGTYVLDIPDVPPLIVTYQDGKLYGQAVGPPVHFKNQGNGVFQAEVVDARLTFPVGGAQAASVTIEQGGGKFTAKRQ